MSILNMSGVNISYEIDSGCGENKFFDKSSIKSKEKSSYASIIAGEIVNEILENALDIATKASDTGIDWREIKKSQSNLKISMSSSFNNIDDSKTEANDENDELPANNLCCDIIGDIIDNAGITSSPNISDIIESLNNINTNQDANNEKQAMVPLEIEMKKLLSEILAPPYEIIDYECVPLKGGIGDQPNIEHSQKVIEKCASKHEIARPSVEKKNRVTDLVKNSPQIITDYLKEDKMSKKNKEDWEENEELLVNVIELDCIEPTDAPFKVSKKYFPELIPLPYDSDDDEILKMCSDDKMDLLNRTSPNLQNEKQQLKFCTKMSDLAKGDEQNSDNKNAVTINEIITESFNKSNEKLNITSNNVQNEKSKKKKWNLGNRIWRFFKRGRKQELVQSCSTST